MDKLGAAAGLSKQRKASMTHPRTLHGNYAIILITDGHGYFEDFRTEKTPVVSDTLIYLYPEEWHRYNPNPGTFWNEYWCSFANETKVRLFDRLIPSDQSFFPVPVNTPLIQVFNDIARLYFFRDREYKTRMFFTLHKLLYEAFSLRTPFLRSKKATDDDFVFLAQEHMSNCLSHQTFNIQKFVKKYTIGYEQFRKRFKQETGFAPTQYFHLLKIYRTRELLMHQNMSIKEIAYSLGFNDQYYFSRWFRRHENLSPRAYRKRQISIQSKRS